MLAKQVTFNVSLVLLAIATVLFVLAATRLAKGWMIALGLACFSGAFLVDRLWP